jgi:hypothetical protein
VTRRVVTKPETRAPLVEVRAGNPWRGLDGNAHQLFAVQIEGVHIDSVSSLDGAQRLACRIQRALRGFRKPIRGKAPP